MVDIGYSGTPLAKKLGIKSPLKLLTVNAPQEYVSWLGELPEGVTLVTKTKKPIEAAHVFTTESAFLNAVLSKLRNELKQDGFVWVSWPKKASKIPTDIYCTRSQIAVLRLNKIEPRSTPRTLR